jgi:hypothetical protein
MIGGFVPLISWETEFQYARQQQLVKRTCPALGFIPVNARGLELFELKLEMLVHQHQRLQGPPHVAVTHGDNPVYQRFCFLVHDTFYFSYFYSTLQSQSDYPGPIGAKFSQHGFESTAM